MALPRNVYCPPLTGEGTGIQIARAILPGCRLLGVLRRGHSPVLFPTSPRPAVLGPDDASIGLIAQNAPCLALSCSRQHRPRTCRERSVNGVRSVTGSGSANWIEMFRAT